MREVTRVRFLSFYTLQHTATHCNTLQHECHTKKCLPRVIMRLVMREMTQETHCLVYLVLQCGRQCNTLHYTATHCNTLQHTATHCNTLQHTATHCNTLQHTATSCNTLQHTATHCNTRDERDDLTKTLCGVSFVLRCGVYCNTLQHTLQHTVTLVMKEMTRVRHFMAHHLCCSVLQCVAVCCSVLQYIER